MRKESIGVCTWCVDRNDVVRAIELAASELDVSAIQIGFFSREALKSADARAISEAASGAGVSVVGSFVGFDGEDYASIARIATTGGYTWDEEYPARLACTEEAAKLASEIGCQVLGVHVGTIPRDPASPVRRKLAIRVREVAGAVARRGVRLILETGREPVGTLLAFSEEVAREDVGVSFDPANLVIYGADDPVCSVSKLAGRIDMVHVKDAFLSAEPGIVYGGRAPLAMGDVGIPQVISGLLRIGYDGPVLIECSPGKGGLAVIRDAVSYVRSLVGAPSPLS